MLRKSIEAAIEAAEGDARKAAISVCLLLEDQIGLSGNGWFDDDAELQDLMADPN